MLRHSTHTKLKMASKLHFPSKRVLYNCLNKNPVFLHKKLQEKNILIAATKTFENRSRMLIGMKLEVRFLLTYVRDEMPKDNFLELEKKVFEAVMNCVKKNQETFSFLENFL